MQEMACELVGDIVLCIHTAAPPTDAGWQTYVDACLASARLHHDDFSLVRQLVFTDGGGPNTGQRERVVAAVEKLKGAKEGRVAVVSSSAVVRGIVTVFNWFNFSVKAFAPSRLDEALRFLSVNASETTRLWRSSERLCRGLAGGSPKSVTMMAALAGAASPSAAAPA